MKTDIRGGIREVCEVSGEGREGVSRMIGVCLYMCYNVCFTCTFIVSFHSFE